jgi:hypothetical protein
MVLVHNKFGDRITPTAGMLDNKLEVHVTTAFK